MALFENMKKRLAREAAMREFRKDIRRDPGLPGIPGVGQWRNPVAMLIQDRPGNGQFQGFFESPVGKIYRQLMEQEEIPLADVYFTSALKSEMPHDRSVNFEIAVWRRYLEREIEIVRPYCLLVVGALARRVIQDTKGLKSYGRKIVTA